MTETALYAKAKVLVDMLEDKESTLNGWQKKGIFDYLEECQKLMTTEDRRKDHRRGGSNGHR